MRWAAFLLVFLGLAGACVVEDRPVADSGVDGGGDASACGGCADDTPVCIEATETCVQCTADEDDYCVERRQVCDDDTNRCIDCVIEDGCCLADTDCTTVDASRCDLAINACAPCQANADCDGVDGLDPTGNACDEGVCRACTPASETETCPSETTCNPATFTCTGEPAGSLAVCESCVADSECGDDGEPSDAYRCVPMTYQGEAFPGDGTGFCLKISLGGCQRPYSVPILDRPSLTRPTQLENYCGIDELRVTCPAIIGLLEDDRCTSGNDDQCQVSGLCRRVGALENRCTYKCGLPAQCPDDAPANTCGSSGSGGDDYCGG